MELMISEEQLGAAVRELRKAAGISQRELAEKAA
jgi:transcriptional regulator with XRE-family HTH domain